MGMYSDPVDFQSTWQFMELGSEIVEIGKKSDKSFLKKSREGIIMAF
ncbi:hypothetical protein ACFLRW_00130 [Acidobacteriota bacterium]